jgi:16S rRNA (guanine966-N2)-methyltransferase
VKAQATARRPAGEVRIIGGHLKRSILPVVDRPGLRPTPQRVRQTLFDWLSFLCGQAEAGSWQQLQVADVFAGTGALGFEAASRGAARVDLVERDTALVEALQRARRRFQADNVDVHRGDGLVWLARQPPASRHLVLLDPPFEAQLFERALQAARPVVRADGWIYLEAPSRLAEPALQALALRELRHLQAGAVHAHLLAPMA